MTGTITSRLEQRSELYQIADSVFTLVAINVLNGLFTFYHSE